jgi:RNA polymerase sigma factor (sigma-70 family)
MQHTGDIKHLWASLLQAHTAEAALEQLFRLFYDDLFAYACKVLGQKALAADALQNTFADLWSYRLRLQPDVAVRAYLFRTTRNHCVKIAQKQQTTLPVEIFAEQLYFEPDELVLHEATDIQKHALAKALNTLSPRQREILFLKFYDNLDYAEIATVLGINYQSVVNHAHLAIRRLRDMPALKM